MTVNAKARVLRDRLAKGEFILAPGIYDGISARVADQHGVPGPLYDRLRRDHLDARPARRGLATYSDMVGRAEMICSVIDTPLIADADTGYGGLLNVQRTVRGYEARAWPRSRSRTRRCPRSAATRPAAGSCRSRTWC